MRISEALIALNLAEPEFRRVQFMGPVWRYSLLLKHIGSHVRELRREKRNKNERRFGWDSRMTSSLELSEWFQGARSRLPW